MYKTPWVPAALLAVCCSAGCALPTSVGSYLENRRQDLIDVAHVDFSTVDVGAVVYVGPLTAGCQYATGGSGGRSSTLQIGLGGTRMQGRRGIAAGLIVPLSSWNEDKQALGPRPKRTPSGTSVGASVGLLAGVGAEADVLELVDFVLGVACIDVVSDDRNTVKPSMDHVEKIAADAATSVVTSAATTAIKYYVGIP